MRQTISSQSVRSAFTLVELLIVLAIFTILAAIALPTVKGLLEDQKVANASRGLSAYLELARNQAIAENRPTGVLLERLSSSDVFGRSVSIRARQLRGVPPYAGDASDSRAALAQDPNWPAVGHPLRPTATDPDPIPGVDTAVFYARDNQLLWHSARILSRPATVPPTPVPIQRGDLLELPGGRMAAIETIQLNGTTPETITVHFDLAESTDVVGTTSSRGFPASLRPTRWSYPTSFPSPPDAPIPNGVQTLRYKIHRRPIVSLTSTFDLPRGIVIDMNYSGVGVRGNEFAPRVIPPSPAPIPVADNISIVFGTDGKVINYTDSTGNLVQPLGLIFLCVGDADGAQPDNLVIAEKKATANILNLDSAWVVINPSTGQSLFFAVCGSLCSTHDADYKPE